MKNRTTKAVLILFVFSLLILSSCGKKNNNPTVQNKDATMRMEVFWKGDLQSQVAVLTFLAVNTQSDLINIINDTTGVITAGPFLQNADFSAHKFMTFHSAAKVNSVSVMLAISPKVYTTSQDEDLLITIKIYFDGKLKDNQSFFYDELGGGVFTTPKDFNYKVAVDQ
jgi:hypothetical protein